MNDLKGTIPLMVSTDYSDRLRAEYYQVKIRYDSLLGTIAKMEAGVMEAPCPVGLYAEQGAAMLRYLKALETRANVEGVEL